MGDTIFLSRLSVYLRLLVLKTEVTFSCKMEMIGSQKHGENHCLLYYYYKSQFQ